MTQLHVEGRTPCSRLGLIHEEAETGRASGPEGQPSPAVWSSGSSRLTGLSLLCPGTPPEGPMPGGGDEDEDAEGAAELPEVPLEPRSPQQVGRTLRPAKLSRPSLPSPCRAAAAPRAGGACGAPGAACYSVFPHDH